MSSIYSSSNISQSTSHGRESSNNTNTYGGSSHFHSGYDKCANYESMRSGGYGGYGSSDDPYYYGFGLMSSGFSGDDGLLILTTLWAIFMLMFLGCLIRRKAKLEFLTLTVFSTGTPKHLLLTSIRPIRYVPFGTYQCES